MHAETDNATKWQTMAAYTGHSVRYLKVRAWVRSVPLLALAGTFIYALTR